MKMIVVVLASIAHSAWAEEECSLSTVGRSLGTKQQALLNCSVVDYPNATDTAIGSINASGDFAGEYIVAGRPYGFINTAGEFTSVDYPNSTSTIVYGLNDYGDSAGTYRVPDTTAHGFVRDGSGAFTAIDFTGAPNTRLRGIDNEGLISGDYCDEVDLARCNFSGMTSGIRHGFTLANDNFNVIDVPDSTYTETWGHSIGTGETFGRYRDFSGHSHLYVLNTDGTFNTIDFPGAVETAYGNYNDVGGINNSGDIASAYCSAAPCPVTSADIPQHPGVVHGGILTHCGRFFTVDYPGAAGTILFGVNDDRQVVGAIVTADGHSRGLLCQ